MQKLDWFLSMLQGDFNSAEEGVSKEVVTSGGIKILNLLAIKLLKGDYEGVMRVSEKALEGKPNIYDEVLIKILEYRLAASILTKDFHKMLDVLRRIRTRIFAISPAPALLCKINSWYEILNMRKVLNLRRQILRDQLEEPPLSKFALALLTKFFKDEGLGGLDPSAKRELVSYVAALMAHTPFAKDALVELKRHSGGEIDHNVLIAKGKILFLLEKPMRALGAFIRALNLPGEKKDKFEALVNISQIYALHGEYRLALEYVKQALLINQDPTARLLRGEILLNMGYYEEASLAFKALVQVNDKRIRVPALLGLSECYIAKGDFKAAFDIIWRAYMLYPNELVRIYADVLKRCMGR